MSAGAAATTCEIADGILALPQSLVWIERTRTLVAADVHLAYEDVIGGALPLWSTASLTATLALAIARMKASELILLGDVIHGSSMSDGAAGVVRAALEMLRDACDLVLVAGNHEGRGRGVRILGKTVEHCERAGWRLEHGDVAGVGQRSIVGHLHPSLSVGGGASVPVAVGGAQLVVVPAMTPYSPGLNVLSQTGSIALRAFGVDPARLQVVASGDDRVYPFGAIGELQSALRMPNVVASNGRRRKVLRPDHP